jgi:hypothetical protein
MKIEIALRERFFSIFAAERVLLPGVDRSDSKVCSFASM